jgi:hypothetical protein
MREERKGAQRVVVTYFMISAKDMASSTPGMANARSCIMVPIMPFWSAVQKKKKEKVDGACKLRV